MRIYFFELLELIARVFPFMRKQSLLTFGCNTRYNRSCHARGGGGAPTLTHLVTTISRRIASIFLHECFTIQS